MLLEIPERAERTDRVYPPEDAESRRALVKRIVASTSFARSNRLSEFLKYVYALAEKGRFDDIHEQNIGSAVFGRTRDYDPAVDSIVRSHASRLRHRLREYFEQEGRHEALILTIPRGSYIPSFEARLEWPPVAAPETTIPIVETQGDGLPLPTGSGLREETPVLSVMTERTETEQETPGGDAANRRRIRRLTQALIVTGVAVVLLAAGLAAVLGLRTPSGPGLSSAAAASRHPLWSQFAENSGAKTMVVSSDSGLVMYEHLTGRGVSLASYMSGEYLKNTSSESVPEGIVRKFGTRRYTPALDLSALERLTHIFGENRDRVSFHYARDLRIEDMKDGNAILLGTSESNPWVQLFEPSMNFQFEDDLLHDKAQMKNRNPLPGEATHYDSTPQDAAPTVYGVVAYRPNIPRSGHVLILEGQTMAGTQAASDFVFDDSYLLPFLNKIRKNDGGLPYFEVLLRSRSLGGQSSRIEVVAYRTEKE